MIQQDTYKNIWRFYMSTVNLLINVGLWLALWTLHYEQITERQWFWKGQLLIASIYAFILAMITIFYGGYRIGYHRLSDVVLSNVLACVITNGITFLQLCLIAAGWVNPFPMLLLTVAQAPVAALWAYGANRIYIRKFPPHTMLLIYGGGEAARSLITKMLGRSEKYRIQETVCIQEGIDQVRQKMDGYRAVILCDIPSKDRNGLLKYCFEQSIRTYVTPKISDILIRGSDSIHLFDTPLLLSRNQGFTLEQRVVKRMMDLFVSTLALVIASPIMLIVAIAIKLDDRGPVLYSQQRLTRGGKAFSLYKFRSMVMDAEKQGATLAAEGDQRITRVGRVLRKYRLDELPQLINIFRGDMALVGPRPERPELTEMYCREMKEFSFRLKVKAGLTGYAQVMGKYNTTPYDKLKLDLMYISGYSLALDLSILLLTLKILFLKDKTEGV